MIKHGTFHLIIFISLCFSCIGAKAQLATSPPDSTRSTFEIGIYAGAGLVRNTLAPEFDLSATFDVKKRMQFRLNLSSFYFFDKTSDHWNMNDHYLLGAEFLFSTLFFNLFPENTTSKRTGFGIAYLVGRKGDYFTGTTMKFYLLADHGIRIRPELWMTDNFQTFFPGIAVVF